MVLAILILNTVALYVGTIALQLNRESGGKGEIIASWMGAITALNLLLLPIAVVVELLFKM